jgi:putative ABC transport system ATP-binding protein
MIHIENVTKVHKMGEAEVHALRGVSCSIATGTFTFIVGPSGSGKSTLLNLLGALDIPTTGHVQIEGKLLSDLTERERDEFRRNEVGFVFQNFNLLKNLTAIDNVLVPFMPSGINAKMKQDAIELLKQVGLQDRLDHRPGQLSGGEQQRVAIARALFKRPSLILADEPTGELDSETGAEIFQILRDVVQQRQTTVIVVTHDRRYIAPEDRLIEMTDGRICSDSMTENTLHEN